MKKLLSVILAITLLLAAATVFACEDCMDFEDNVSEWAKESILKAKELSIIPDIASDYTKPVTREEFCEIVYRYADKVIKKAERYYFVNFDDTNNTAVESLFGMGIVNGKSETKFKPNDFLTREEAAVILTRLVNKTIPVPVTEMYYSFDDEQDISDWAKESVQTMCNMGVMSGVGDDRFAPGELYTTEQAIVSVMRIFKAQDAQFDITDTVTIDKFYLDKSYELINESMEIVRDDVIYNMFMYGDGDTKPYQQILNSINLEKPTNIYYIDFDCDVIVDVFEQVYKQEFGSEIDMDKFLKWQNFNFLETFIESKSGIHLEDNFTESEFLSHLANKSGYIKPKNFRNNFGLLFEYDSDYGVFVSFYEYGDDVIMADMNFVKNCDKYSLTSFKDDMMISDMEEIQLTGEIITIAKVEY